MTAVRSRACHQQTQGHRRSIPGCRASWGENPPSSGAQAKSRAPQVCSEVLCSPSSQMRTREVGGKVRATYGSRGGAAGRCALSTQCDLHGVYAALAPQQVFRRGRMQPTMGCTWPWVDLCRDAGHGSCSSGAVESDEVWRSRGSCMVWASHVAPVWPEDEERGDGETKPRADSRKPPGAVRAGFGHTHQRCG